MRTLTALFFMLCLGVSFGQEKKEVSKKIIEQIKEDIWIPFMESYAELDANKLKSIHSKDIVRITIDQNEIKTGESYLDYFGGFLEIVKSDGGELGIAFTISSTAVDESKELAYQTGYYRFSSKRPEQNEITIGGYGHFNVGLKKVNGVWKIWLDSDKRIDITHEDFNNQDIVYKLEGTP